MQRSLAEVAPAGTRMNDAACDPQGRFWAGTLADDHQRRRRRALPARPERTDRAGARRSDDLQRPRVEPGRHDDVRRRQRRPRAVHAFAFDAERGTISEGRVLVTVAEEVGAPDGMTVDADGDLWVAVYGGGRVHRYSPDGDLREVLVVPAEQTHVLRVRGPGLTGSTSRQRPRAGPTSSVGPSPPPGSSTGSTPTPPAGRLRRSARTPSGGRGSPADRFDDPGGQDVRRHSVDVEHQVGHL